MDLKLQFFLCKSKYNDFTSKSIEDQVGLINKDFNLTITVNEYELFLYNELVLFKSEEDFELESRRQINNYQENLEFYEREKDYSSGCEQVFS